MSWDLDHLRRIAGIDVGHSSVQSLNEGWDDDDDEDPDVRAADSEAKKRGIKLPKVKNVDPDKDLHALARSRKSHDKEDDKEADKEATKASKPVEKKEPAKPAEKKEEPKPAEKKEEPKAAEKKEEATEKKEEVAEKKKRGKAPNPASKSGQLRAWIASHPGAKRSEAWAYAQTMDPPFTKAGFSTIYQGIKKKMTSECYIIRHPSVPGFILQENAAMNQYEWISDLDVLGEPLVFETEEQAKKVVSYLSDFKNLNSVVDRVELD